MSSDEKYTKQFFNMARSKHAIAKAIVDNIQYLAKKERVSNAELEKDANITRNRITPQIVFPKQYLRVMPT